MSTEDNTTTVKEQKRIDKLSKSIKKVNINIDNLDNGYDTSSNLSSGLSSPIIIEGNNDAEDPLCVAENPHKITFQDVTTAAFIIKGGVEYTPCPVSEFFLHTTIRIINYRLGFYIFAP